MRPAGNDAALQPALPARVPSLDGLRAVSVSLVILAHLATNAGWTSWSQPTWCRIAFNGALGVSIFFGISGFIISLNLLEEKAKTGRVSLKSFYLRRLFRIVPPFYVYVGFVAILALFRLSDATPRDFWSALSFTWNYTPRDPGPTGWQLGHSWSLAVEEQFYLCWPLVVARLRREHLLRLMLVVIACQPVMRWLWEGLQSAYGLRLNLADLFHYRLDAFLWGAVAAYVYQRRHAQPEWLAVFRGIGVKIFALLTFLMCYLAIPIIERNGHPLGFNLFFTLQSFSIALWILVLVVSPGGLIGGALNLAPVRFVGLISYSLYLWQEPFVGGEPPLRVFERLPLNVCLLVGSAVLSYWVVERGALRLRRRL